VKATQLLHNLGQSIWLDNITRDLLDTGTLRHYIDELSVTGLTSNPTIFEHAIKNGASYDAQIHENVARAKSGEDLFFEVALQDITRAADLFLPIHEKTNGVDGWVSLEVSPLLAYNTASTLSAAKALFARAGRPNVFIKIPGTREGLPAIEEAIFAGVPINVTLLFSREQYLAAAEAFHRGIERRLEAGANPSVGSVASVFVSRWDAAVADKVPPALRNQLGIAMAERTYKAARSLLTSPAWQRIYNAGARPQRLLWASTGTKDPSASDIPVCQGTGCSVHCEHHASGHSEGACDPYRTGIHPTGRWWRLRRGPGAIYQGRNRPRRACRQITGGRCKVIRQVLERTYGGHCVQERHPQEGQLAHAAKH